MRVGEICRFREILEVCGNAYLRAAYGFIEHKIHAMRWRLPESNEKVEHCQANHSVIVAQVRRSSVGKAQAALRRHIHETYDAYFEASRIAAAAAERPPA